MARTFEGVGEEVHGLIVRKTTINIVSDKTIRFCQSHDGKGNYKTIVDTDDLTVTVSTNHEPEVFMSSR